MPRRKGHGIPPTKRVKVENHVQPQYPSDATTRTTYIINNSNSDPLSATNKLKRNSAIITNKSSSKDGDYNMEGNREEKSGLWFSDLEQQSKSESTPVSDNQNNNSNHKYLHKKFKKMASTILSPEEPNTAEPIFNNEPSTTINGGQRVKGVLCSVPVNSNSNSDNSCSKLNITSNKSELLDNSVTSNDSNIKTNAKLIANDSGTRTESPSGRYKCRYCELPCAKPSVLQKHIRAHTNERPYPCRPCGFAFKTKSNLYKHRRSRTHIRKVEESGIDEAIDKLGSPLTTDDNGDSSNEEDDVLSQSNSILGTATTIGQEKSFNCHTRTVTPPEDIIKNDNDQNDKNLKTIYKPKFHTASIYLDNRLTDSFNNNMSGCLPNHKEEDKNNLPKQHPNLVLKMPSVSGISGQQSNSLLTPLSTPSPFTSGSSPSPEFLQRHITKLICENQAIVDKKDPFWPKKFLHRSNSREAPVSPLSTSPTPTFSDVISKKSFPKFASADFVGSGLQFKSGYKDLNQDVISEYEKLKQNLQNVQSKLALALLRPQMPASPCNQPALSPVPDVSITLASDPQPLNLSTNNSNSNKNEIPAVIYNRKRSYSEGFPSTSLETTCEVEKSNLFSSQVGKSTLRSHLLEEAIKLRNANNNNNNNAVVLRSLTSSEIKQLKAENPESSIIKDLLLNTRPDGVGGITTGMPFISGPLQPHDLAVGVNVTSASIEHQRLNACEQRYNSQSQLICQFCNLSFKNAQTLQTHQNYHCKECVSVVPPRLSCSPKHSIGGNKHVISAVETLRSSPAKERWEMRPASPNLTSPPFHSPGPLLGNTPLVDNNIFNAKNVERQIKHTDNDNNNNSKSKKSKLNDGVATPVVTGMSSPLVTKLVHQQQIHQHQELFRSHQESRPVSSGTLRSLEELSKCPMMGRSNSLQMFGGEVQILDYPSGETKTLRIEPSNRSSSSEIQLINKENDSDNESLKMKESSHSPHIVVTIAKTGFHSGGTIVQLPQPQHRTTTTATAAAIMVVNGNEISADDCRPCEEEVQTAHCKKYSSDPIPKYPDTNKLIIPIIPNISVPGIPPLVVPFGPLITVTANNPHGRHQPQQSHPHLQPPGISVINPLTNITGYNPLTLPTVSPDLINSNSDGGSKSSQYGGGIVTIWHGGKAIPYVPGMPGPQTLVHTTPVTVAAVSPSSVTTTTTTPSESKVSVPANKLSDTSNNNSHNTSNKNHSDNDKSKCTKRFSVQMEDEKVITSKFNIVNNSNLKNLSTSSIESQQCSDKNINSMRTSTGTAVNSVGKPPVMGSKRTSVVSPLPVISIERVSSSDNQSSESKSEKKFLRPTSLPLKPGTFIPKKHTLSTPNNVLPLVSPETPRPRKSYGQLYLNGHAYTYLGLKCSTRVFFCTLNKPQPIYVPLTPEHCNISMYSNWKVCSDADPNPFGLDPGKAMRYYDSRHRQSCFTIAQAKSQLTVTHSSHWINGSINNSEHIVKQFPSSVIIKSSSDSSVTPFLKTSSPSKLEKEETTGTSESEENTPKRVKIFDGGFESNEDYIYIRGRGRGRYVCEECGIRCKKPSMLKKHIRTHTDVRPYTCKQCSFSFKTKGNLTKHMKSKAHYKKCVELGLNPVPTLVDDSCINEEMLMKQQAMRADQGLLGNEETDEEEDEDDEDDEEDEEDEDEDDEGDGGDNWSSKLEREAACSLLSLSEGTISAVSALSSPPLSHVRAGLVAIRPSTYPYSFTYTSASSQATQQPQTPTLTAMTAQREREKVSQNTGLARDLSSDEQQVTMCPAQKPAARLESGSDCVVTSRYYFPSVQNKLLLNEKTAEVGTLDRNPATDVHSEEMVALNDPVLYDTSKDNITVSTSPSVVPVSSYPINERSNLDSNSAASTPIDLSNKSVDDSTSKLVNNLRSQVQTCEAALLLASLCSTVDSLPLSKRSSSHMSTDMMVDISSPTVDDGRNNHLMQAYITERAVKQQTIKQHQSYNNRNNSHDRSNVELSTVTGNHQNKIMKSDDAKIITSTTAPTNTISTVSSQSSVLLSSSSSSSVLSSKLVVTEVGGHSGVRFNEDSGNEVVPSVQTSVTSATISAVSVADSISDLPHSIAKENALDILAKTSLASDAAKRQALKLSSVSPNSISTSVSSSGSPNKKLKAEFLPPSSGPSPSYVSMLEDGRSMCLICNKIFTKPSQMKLHVNIHYFERPFRCESCAVSFRTKGHLQKHQRSVTHLNKMSMNSTFGTATTSNPRPFKCDDCKIAFRIHGHLAKHLRSKMHIMKLECLGKLPFGTYAEMERSGINMNDIDTSDCENSLESLQLLAQKLYEKDPTKLGQWDPTEMLPLSAQHQHRSNSSSTSMVVDHHGSLTQHQNYHQQQEHMNDDASSNEDEDNDNENVNESPSSDMSNFSTSVTGSSMMIINRNNVNINSIPHTVSNSEDISGVTGNKQFSPKGKYHLSSSDNGIIPTMVPTQSPVQQSVHHILKKKCPNNIDSPFSGTNSSNRSTSGTETQYVYLKKMPPPVSSSVISSSGGVISSVTDYTNSSPSKLTDGTVNATINNSSLLDVSGYNKNSKFKIDEDQSKIVVTSNIAKPNPGVIGINSSDNSNLEYCYNRNINTSRGTNFVTTTSSASSKMNVFCSNVNISSSNNNSISSDLNSNRSVIQRLGCNLDQPDHCESDSSVVNSFICDDKNVHRNNDEINVDCRKVDVGGSSQGGSSDRSKFSCSETVIENLNMFSERTKVNINSSVTAPSSVVPCESLTDNKISASTANSDSLSIENCS